MGSVHRRILVTGATGFIGSHLVEVLVRRGHRVRALARTNALQSLGRIEDLAPEIRKEVEIVWGDLRDRDAVSAAVDHQEAVLHLGALISVSYSYQRPEETAEVNVMGTLNLARAALHEKVGLFVHTSTSEIYGSAVHIPMKEDHPLQAQSPYAASKIGGEKIIESFHKSFGLPAVILRPFNTFGPRQTPRAVIPLVLSQILFSDRVRMGSLAPKRDYTFATDTAEAYLAVLDAPEPPVGETLHFGSGRAHSIGEIVTLAARAAGREVPVETDPARVRPCASEVMHLECDASAFRARTGWAPRVAIEEGLRLTAEWLRARPEAAHEALRAL